MTAQSLTPKIDVFNLPVFRDADIFPMIPADELAELAEDIQENGLNEPVVVAKVADEWMLIDGRNRREACRLAGITPTYRILEADAEKLKSLVWSWNGPRRHLTSSQKAMAYAMMFPVVKRGGDRHSSAFKSQNNDLNQSERNAISLARFILKHAPETAKLVRDGHPNYPLSKTYDAVKDEVARREKEAEEERLRLEKLAALRSRYPDLAELVDEDRLKLHVALAEADARDHEKAEEARREKEAEEERLAEEERERLEQERLEQERYEANRAAFHSSLSQLISGSVIIQNPADCENPAKWKGTWTTFHNRYQIPIHEARERLKNLQARIPFILETLEAMRDE